jgi:hypothetical protein
MSDRPSHVIYSFQLTRKIISRWINKRVNPWHKGFFQIPANDRGKTKKAFSPKVTKFFATFCAFVWVPNTLEATKKNWGEKRGKCTEADFHSTHQSADAQISILWLIWTAFYGVEPAQWPKTLAKWKTNFCFLFQARRRLRGEIEYLHMNVCCVYVRPAFFLLCATESIKYLHVVLMRCNGYLTWLEV